MSESEMRKITWRGTILSIQPRTTVWRYRIDNRTHRHIGYNIFLDGEADGVKTRFSIAISEKQQQTAGFRIGDEAKGTAWTKKYPEWEYADYYRAGGLKRINPNNEITDEYNAPGRLGEQFLNPCFSDLETTSPPWIGAPPGMETYEWRGCRVLSKSCWSGKCFQCKWAAMANVTIEYDWGIKQKYRFESFCYGPKSCKLYKKGKSPMVPYKGGGSIPDEHGGFDEICTERRGWDD